MLCGLLSRRGARMSRRRGVFDFRHVTRVLDAMEEAGISVIVGTPTYAIPTWMVKAHPDILATTKQGPRYLRCAADHGYYASGISFLCRADHSEADGGNGTPKMCHWLPARQ